MTRTAEQLEAAWHHYLVAKARAVKELQLALIKVAQLDAMTGHQIADMTIGILDDYKKHREQEVEQ